MSEEPKVEMPPVPVVPERLPITSVDELMQVMARDRNCVMVRILLVLPSGRQWNMLIHFPEKDLADVGIVPEPGHKPTKTFISLLEWRRRRLKGFIKAHFLPAVTTLVEAAIRGINGVEDEPAKEP